MRIFSDPSVEHHITEIYADYHLAYVGKHFSNAFINWNRDFCQDIADAVNNEIAEYSGKVCALNIKFMDDIYGNPIAFIYKCSLNEEILKEVANESEQERHEVFNPTIDHPRNDYVDPFPNGIPKLNLEKIGSRKVFKCKLSNGKYYLCNKFGKRIGETDNYDSISNVMVIKGKPCVIAKLGDKAYKIGLDGNIISEAKRFSHNCTVNQLKKLITEMAYQGICENLFTHDESISLYKKLDEYNISYDTINDYENILEINIDCQQTRKKVYYLLNMFGWKNIKETKNSIFAERIYGDKWNDYAETPECDDDEYEVGKGIYYHITPSNKVQKILKQGLTVREGNKLGYKRGARTYMLSYPSRELAYDFKHREYCDDYTILKVDIRNYLGKQINIYHDDLTYYDGAVYTYDYIPPQCISIYERLNLNEQRLRYRIDKYVRKALSEAFNEKTLSEHRSYVRRRPNRVRNL